MERLGKGCTYVPSYKFYKKNVKGIFFILPVLTIKEITDVTYVLFQELIIIYLQFFQIFRKNFETLLYW